MTFDALVVKVRAKVPHVSAMEAQDMGYRVDEASGELVPQQGAGEWRPPEDNWLNATHAPRRGRRR